MPTFLRSTPIFQIDANICQTDDELCSIDHTIGTIDRDILTIDRSICTIDPGVVVRRSSGCIIDRDDQLSDLSHWSIHDNIHEIDSSCSIDAGESQEAIATTA